MKKVKTKSKVQLFTGLLVSPLLSGCLFDYQMGSDNQGSSFLSGINQLLYPKTSPKMIAKKNSVDILKAAQTAPNPKLCKGSDSCYFQYINDRSMSLSISKSEDGKIGSQFGTGWILDREVGTNNFYVVSNVHVWNLRSDDFKENDPQPKMIELKIGKQKYDKNLGNKNTHSLALGSFHSVKTDFSNHYHQNNRIIIETNGGGIRGKKDYDNDPVYLHIAPQLLPQATAKYLNNLKRPNEAFFNLLIKETIKALKTHPLIWETKKHQQLINKSDFLSIMEQSMQDDEEGIFSSQKLKNKDTIISEDALDTDGIKRLIGWKDTSQFTTGPDTKKKFIDGAILKMEISDQILANWFPYFLDPTKYNDWTFPRLSQTNLVNLEFNQRSFPDNQASQDYNANQRKTVYRAGYPVEQVNRNLTYRSKSGPIFKMTKSKLDSFYLVKPDSKKIMDNYTCDYQVVDNCSKDRVPMGSINVIMEDEYHTGGGSSGSMIIDENYNTVGIYWGGYADRSANYSSFKEYGLSQPLFINNIGTYPYQITDLTELGQTELAQYRRLMQNHFLQIYLRRKTDQLWEKYQTIKDSNGLDFTDLDQLLAGLNSMVTNNSNQNSNSSHEKSGSFTTDEQKKQQIKKALKKGFIYDNILFKFSILEYFYEYILEKLLVDFRGNNLITPHHKYVQGVNLKQQLTNYFKNNNIHTYNLNKPTSLPTKQP